MSELVLPIHATRAWLSRRALLTLVLALASTGLCAAWFESTDAVGAPDRSLAFVLGVVLPLCTFSLVRIMANGESLRSLARAEARHGANRRAHVLKNLAFLGALTVLLAVLLTSAALLLSHGLSGDRLVADVMASVPVACAAALTYTSCLAAGASFGARGAGSLGVLVVDAVVGSFPVPVSWAMPRGHVRHLLGLEGAAALPQWVSFPVLLGFALVGLGVLCVRVPR